MKKKPDPKPFFPLKHDFCVSLDRYIQTSGTLAGLLGTAIRLGAVQESIVPSLQKALDDFNAARSDDEEEAA
jgi:hypothetical protein